MPIDYRALGPNAKLQHRRYKVLRLYLKGATPPEIAHMTGETIKTVDNDLQYLRTKQLNELPLMIMKDMGNSFYELKIRELEAEIAKLPNKTPEDIRSYSNTRLGYEKLIQKYKEQSLQLMGAFTERVEHTGQVALIFEEVDGTGNKESASNPEI